MIGWNRQQILPKLCNTNEKGRKRGLSPFTSHRANRLRSIDFHFTASAVAAGDVATGVRAVVTTPPPAVVKGNFRSVRFARNFLIYY